MTLGSRSLISHHGWTLSQITYIGPTAELARKRLMWGLWESLLSKATRKARHHASISGSAGSYTQAIRSCFVNPQGVSSRSSDTSGSTLPSTSHTSLDTAVVTGDVIRAEVLWTLKVVMCHYSFNSCNDISATFRAMFHDSGIAKTKHKTSEWTSSSDTGTAISTKVAVRYLGSEFLGHATAVDL